MLAEDSPSRHLWPAEFRHRPGQLSL